MNRLLVLGNGFDLAERATMSASEEGSVVN